MADPTTNLTPFLTAVRNRLAEARDFSNLSQLENGLKCIEKGTLAFHLRTVLRKADRLLALVEVGQDVVKAVVKQRDGSPDCPLSEDVHDALARWQAAVGEVNKP